MNRIADFNIHNSKQQHAASNTCNVTINNSTSPSKKVVKKVVPRPTTGDTPSPSFGYPPIQYPTPPDNLMYAPGPYADSGQCPDYTPHDSIMTRSIDAATEETKETSSTETSANYESIINEHLKTIESLTLDSSLNKTIAQCYGHILKDLNIKLIANLIDQSRYVIVDITCLTNIIAIIVGVDAAAVHILYSVPNIGCTGSYNPIRTIDSIKINNLDFHLMYNEKYNILTDSYFISLNKVYVEPSIINALFS